MRSLCLTDEIPVSQPRGDVVEVLRIGHRDRGVRGEEQPDPLGLVGEGTAS
jgi:hypothetical protein